VIRIETIGKYDKVVLVGEKRNAFMLDPIKIPPGLRCERDLVFSN
jgi:hypothetical protein